MMKKTDLKIAVLTSSRADYGIYRPLLFELRLNGIEPSIIAFGTHLSKKHGYTIKEIEKDKFNILARYDTSPDGDRPYDIVESMALTQKSMNELWKNQAFDLVFALGDRYEMASAVASALPYGIRIAHLHGGETTLGAIDNAFRHSITHMSGLHFAASELYKERIIELTGKDDNVYNVGALSIDNLDSIDFLSPRQIKDRIRIDLQQPAILVTIHPETVKPEQNHEYIRETISAFRKIKDYQFLITLPNADTESDSWRQALNSFAEGNPGVFVFENLGAELYLSCMKHCSFMLGNTSSGFIEASYFPKYVINLGSRQEGRIETPNIHTIKFRESEILAEVENFRNLNPAGKNVQIYGTGQAAKNIVSILGDIFAIK